VTQTAGLVVKTGGFCDTNRRFGRKTRQAAKKSSDIFFQCSGYYTVFLCL